MPRGQHPNSRANLKKGKSTQFGANGDRTAKEAGKRSGEERRAIMSVSDEMRALADGTTKDGNPRRKVIAAKIFNNIDKSPEWCKLVLRILGELPPEQVDVRNSVLSADAKADLDRLLAETKDDAR